MTKKEEAAYIRGQNYALRSILATVLRELRANGEEVDSAPMVLSDTRVALLDLAGDLGVVCAPNLHPADIVRAISKAVL